MLTVRSAASAVARRRPRGAERSRDANRCESLLPVFSRVPGFSRITARDWVSGMKRRRLSVWDDVRGMTGMTRQRLGVWDPLGSLRGMTGMTRQRLGVWDPGSVWGPGMTRQRLGVWDPGMTRQRLGGWDPRDWVSGIPRDWVSGIPLGSLGVWDPDTSEIRVAGIPRGQAVQGRFGCLANGGNGDATFAGRKATLGCGLARRLQRTRERGSWLGVFARSDCACRVRVVGLLSPLAPFRRDDGTLRPEHGLDRLA